MVEEYSTESDIGKLSHKDDIEEETGTSNIINTLVKNSIDTDIQ